MAETQVQEALNPPAAPTGAQWRTWLEELRKPRLPTIGLLVGAAAALAVTVALALWAGASSYETLYRGLSDADAGEIMSVLQQNNIPFQIDRRTGALQVPEDRVHEVRLKLATQGLPRGAISGFEILDQQNSFGVSQFMENARYQRALEGELARSVMSIQTVQNARVHLALPKETVFIRDRRPPSASVLVQLHPGRILDEGQVAAIVHLVSSSVPGLGADQVSVIDQAGNLLNRPRGETGLALSMDQLNYTRRLEERYIRRIEDILTPLLGIGRVRAQVALEVDFSVAEQTEERFDPQQSPGMMRSERLLEETDARPRPVGIPGALSNQPPGVTAVPEEAQAQGAAPLTDAQSQADATRGQRVRKEATRNYELDRRISHTRHASGRIVRVSAAVVLDDRTSLDQDGNLQRTPLSPEELQRITALVKEAVGFDVQRGDTVNVINATFAASPFAETTLPLWQQHWFLELVKWGVIALLAVLVLLLVVRPLIRRLLPAREPREQINPLPGPKVEGAMVNTEEGLEGLLEDRVQLSGESDAPPLQTPLEQLEQRLKRAKALVAEDPKRAVQVIKNWMVNEAQ